MHPNAIRNCTDDRLGVGLHNASMLATQLLKSEDLKGLGPAELTALATQMLAHIGEQSKHIEALDKRIDSQAQGIKSGATRRSRASRSSSPSSRPGGSVPRPSA